MAKTTVQEIVAKFTGDTRGLDTAINKAKRAMKAFTVVAGAAGAAAVTVGINALKSADNIGKTADKLGVLTSELQELRFAANQAGVAQTTLDMAVQRFTRRSAEAVKGTGEAKDALKQMNIQLVNSQGQIRPTGELLRDVADALKGTESRAERLRLAFKLFDSEGVAMVNMLDDGAAGLDAMSKRAQDLGLVMEDDLIRKAEEAQSQLDTLGQIVKTNFNAGVLDGFVDDFNEFAGQATDPAIADGFREIGEVAGTVAGIVFDIVAGMGLMVSKARDILGLSEEGRIKELEKRVALGEGALPFEFGLKKRGADAQQELDRIQALKDAQEQFKKLRAEADSYKGSVKEATEELVGGSGSLVIGGSSGMDQLENKTVEVKDAMDAFKSSSKDALGGFIDDIANGKDALSSLKSVALDVLKSVLSSFAQTGSVSGGGLGGILSGVLGGISGASGGGGLGSILPFANGGVVNGANVFPIGGNTGVMGEAGPEAILPLTRKGGKLGVQSSGGSGGGIVQNINITTGVQQTVQAEIKRLMPDIKQAAVSGVQDASNRNKMRF